MAHSDGKSGGNYDGGNVMTKRSSLGSSLSASAAAALRFLPPEIAHDSALHLLRWARPILAQRSFDPILSCRIWGRDVDHPLMLAAGFDKDAQAVSSLIALGFAGVEVGTITPYRQAGNPRPRLFRLTKDRAVINRLGFNSAGIDAVLPRLEKARSSIPSRRLLGVSLGVNRQDAQDAHAAAQAYETGARHTARLADYLAINVSSPNTSGLRSLQEYKALRRILHHVRRGCGSHRIPIAIKISPDNSPSQRRRIADFALEENIDALIIGNTTRHRPDDLTSRHRQQAGGLSGRPLRARALDNLRYFHSHLQNRIPIISVGGCEDGRDVYQRLASGATMVQIYTSFLYQGPGIVNDILLELKDSLQRHGTSVARLAHRA